MDLRRALAVTLALAAVGVSHATGQERPGWVGVSMDVVTTNQDGPERTFVRISGVQPGSPAAQAGLRVGDLLLRVNQLAGPAELARLPALLTLHAGDTVRMVVRRGEELHEAFMTAGVRPAMAMAPPMPLSPMGPDPDSLVSVIARAMDSLRVRIAQAGDAPRVRVWAEAPEAPHPGAAPRPPRPPEAAVWRLDATGSFSPLAPYVLGRNRVAGAEVIDVRPELADYFGVDEGILVVDVPAGTPAASAGLRPGDVIVALGEDSVGSIRDLRVSVARGGEALPVWVVRQGERIRLLLTR